MYVSVKHSTYFVTSFEALSLDTGVGVDVDGNTGLVLGSEDVVNLADELLVFGPDLTGKEGHCVALNHADDLTLNDVSHLSDHVKTLGGTAVEATTATEATAAATKAATTATSAESAASAATVTASAEATSSSWFEAHLFVFCLSFFRLFNSVK